MAPSRGDESGLRDIVVVAQKTVQNVQKVAATVNVIAPDTLKELGITQPSQLSQVVPALHIVQNGTAGFAILMRGVGTIGSAGPTGSQGITLYSDGIYLARGDMLQTGLYDVARVEVLKGPQGTLYGRDAIGGSVNVLTNAPALGANEIGVSLDVGNYNLFRVEGAANLAVGKNLAVRVAGVRETRDGYLSNGNDDSNQYGGRVSLLWKPIDGFSAVLRASVYRLKGKGNTEAIYGAADPWYAPYPNSEQYQDKKILLYNAEINKKVGIGTLTYVGGYAEYHQNINADGPSVNQPDSARTFFLTIQDQWSESHELRYSGQVGRVKFVAGAYYFYEHIASDFRQTFSTLVAPSALPVYVTLQPYANTRSVAAFGQLTWEIVPGLRLVGGVREGKDRRAQEFDKPLSRSGTLKYSAFNWKAGVEYDVADRTMLWANVSTGFRSGGLQNTRPPLPIDYGPEHLTAYQGGIKSRLLDNHLQLNAEGFYYDYEDYQIQTQQCANPITPLLCGGASSGLIVNAANARIYGGEIELAWQLTRRDRLHINPSYVHGRLGNGVTTSIVNNQTVVVDFSGNALPDTPELSISYGYEHDFPLAAGAIAAAKFEASYRSSEWLNYNHSLANAFQGSSSRFNASLSYIPSSDIYRVTLWARNIGNERRYISSNASGTRNQIEGPRTFGATLSAHFRN